MAAWMLHGACVGEEAGARKLVFFRVKWLQAAMKGTSCVRRLRLRSFRAWSIPPLCSATNGCSCVRSSMHFLNLLLKRKITSTKIKKICWQFTIAALMQPLQYDLRCPAAKDNIVIFTYAAAAPSNLDAAITMRSAETELQSTKEIRATASVLQLQFPTPLPVVLLRLATPSLRKCHDEHPDRQLVFANHAVQPFVPVRAKRAAKT